MEKTLTSIFESLQALTGLHRQLLELVRVEKTALVDADLKAIHAVTAKKQQLVESIREAEKNRLRWIAELGVEWKRHVQELTLPNIIIEIQAKDPKGAEQLRSIFNALTILIQRITDQNSINRSLVEKSLEHIDQMKKNVLGDSSVRSNTYTPSGQKSGGAPASRLFSGEA